MQLLFTELTTQGAAGGTVYWPRCTEAPLKLFPVCGSASPLAVGAAGAVAEGQREVVLHGCGRGAAEPGRGAAGSPGPAPRLYSQGMKPM